MIFLWLRDHFSHSMQAWVYIQGSMLWTTCFEHLWTILYHDFMAKYVKVLCATQTSCDSRLLDGAGCPVIGSQKLPNRRHETTALHPCLAWSDLAHWAEARPQSAGAVMQNPRCETGNVAKRSATWHIQLSAQKILHVRRGQLSWLGYTKIDMLSVNSACGWQVDTQPKRSTGNSVFRKS